MQKIWFFISFSPDTKREKNSLKNKLKKLKFEYGTISFNLHHFNLFSASHSPWSECLLCQTLPGLRGFFLYVWVCLTFVMDATMFVMGSSPSTSFTTKLSPKSQNSSLSKNQNPHINITITRKWASVLVPGDYMTDEEQPIRSFPNHC